MKEKSVVEEWKIIYLYLNGAKRKRKFKNAYKFYLTVELYDTICRSGQDMNDIKSIRRCFFFLFSRKCDRSIWFRFKPTLWHLWRVLTKNTKKYKLNVNGKLYG